MKAVCSKQPIGEWRGDVAIYRGAFNPSPVGEAVDMSWVDLREVLCPASGAQVIADKNLATYITPGKLKIAPLVGKTLERALATGLPSLGVQRSATHVTSSTFLMFDLDGLPVEQVTRFGQSIARAGLSFFAYTSWSFGRQDKPGVRARFAIPIDRALPNAEYKRAWLGANNLFFEDSADQSGSKLCQQQGTWATSPDRQHLARRWGVTQGVASASELLAKAMPAATTSLPLSAPRTGLKALAVGWDGPPPSMKQIGMAVDVMDPNEYWEWDRTVSLLIALSKGAGMSEAALLKLARAFESRGNAASRAGNAKPQYDTAKRFANWVPTISPSIAAGSLFAGARDKAEATYRHAVAKHRWVGVKPAWTYLAAYHPKRWSAIRAEMEVSA